MIYFITAREVNRVKIGYSVNPRKRFSKIQSDSPLRLTLERVCAGGESDEARLHMRFADERISGEWFELSPEIEAHMETLSLPTKDRKNAALKSPANCENLFGASAAQLKTEIEAFCKAHSMNGSTFSKLATGDPTFWFKFSRGRVPKLDTYDKVRAFMRDYQP